MYYVFDVYLVLWFLIEGNKYNIEKIVWNPQLTLFYYAFVITADAHLCTQKA